MKDKERERERRSKGESALSGRLSLSKVALRVKGRG